MEFGENEGKYPLQCPLQDTIFIYPNFSLCFVHCNVTLCKPKDPKRLHCHALPVKTKNRHQLHNAKVEATSDLRKAPCPSRLLSLEARFTTRWHCSTSVSSSSGFLRVKVTACSQCMIDTFILKPVWLELNCSTAKDLVKVVVTKIFSLSDWPSVF